MAGGTLPTIISRRQPPPQAVVMARTRVPKRSIFLLMPISAPEMAKAMVPMRSKKTISASVMRWDRPLFQNTWAIIHAPRDLGKRGRRFFPARFYTICSVCSKIRFYQWTRGVSFAIIRKT